MKQHDVEERDDGDVILGGIKKDDRGTQDLAK